MKSTISGTAIALAMCVAAGGAQADALDFYVTVESGALLISDTDFSAGAVSADADIGPGYMVGLEGGILHSSGLRAGAEVFFSGLSGSASALGLMGTVGYEYQGFGAFRPFIEGGAGMLRVGVDDVRVTGIAGSLGDSDMVFAAKVGAGFAVPILDQWDFLMHYNYLFTGDADVELTSGGVTTPVSLDFSGHMAGVGLRYLF